MNAPEFPAGGTPPPKKELQLQGPRPPPLKVSKESHKIKKPPPHPAHHHHPHAPPEQNQQPQREPVIIYSVSPKVIHVTPGDFMDVVQRLTGASSGDEQPAGRGDVSPAARLASIEKTSPSERERERAFQSGDDDMMWMLEEGVEVGQFPGILSPEPGTLPPIPAEVFSPAREAQTASSYWNEIWSASSFLASPSGFLSVAVASPQPSPNLFSLFD
ncbi:MKS1 protein [Spatholobus suberectus]|nr:MKS1 protein [Spatholobus suberectus]